MNEESEAPAAGSALPSCDCGLMIETHTTLTMKPREHKPGCAATRRREYSISLDPSQPGGVRIEEASNASAPSGAPKSVSERGGGASLKGK